MDSDARFELFVFWRTSAGYRTRVALALKNLPVVERFVDLDAGEQRSETYLKINPLGAVPALVDLQSDPPHAVITQSLAILEYLDEVAPEPPLLPRDPYGRARVRSLAAMLAGDTHPFLTVRVKRYLTATAEFDDAAWRAWQIHWFTTGLEAVEKRLATDPETGTFCHGETVTIADVCLASIVVVMRTLNIEIAGIPTIDRIVARCEKIEAFVKAEPLSQVGAQKS